MAFEVARVLLRLWQFGLLSDLHANLFRSFQYWSIGFICLY
jgi:hypothetical protein